jgi:hypothetical protein
MGILLDEELLDVLIRLQTEKRCVRFTNILDRIMVEKRDPNLKTSSLKSTLSRKLGTFKKLGYVKQYGRNYQISDEGIDHLNLNRDRLIEHRFNWKEMQINGLTASYATVQNPGRIIAEKEDEEIESKIKFYLRDLAESNINKDFTIKIHQREKRSSS